jgi:hypothetical protein
MLCILRQHSVGGCATLLFTDDDQMSRIVEILDDDVPQITTITLHVPPERLRPVPLVQEASDAP